MRTATLFLVTLSAVQLSECNRFVRTESATANPRQAQAELLAAATLRMFDSTTNATVAERYEKLIDNWDAIILDYRVRVQQVSGVMHEKDAIKRLIAQIRYLYDEAMVPINDIKTVLGPIADKRWRWIAPMASTGYIPMQIQETLGVDMSVYGQTYRAQQWRVFDGTSVNEMEMKSFNVLVLVRPCDNFGCWQPLRHFTRFNQNKRAFVYIGEPRGHCCGDVEMWNYICDNYHIRTFHLIQRGLPASYNYIMLFSPKASSIECVTNPETGLCQPIDEIESLEPSTDDTHFSQFLQYCATRSPPTETANPILE
eukprot:c5839_g1_i2.p1 GENE.c5839_g1_i2~~c5839_g1_i2.p1  ORF type:complete len:312 (+),score=66.02 c5839_g1_i2:53-988(+)